MEAKKRKAEEKDSLSRYVCLRAWWALRGLVVGGRGCGRTHRTCSVVGESERHTSKWGQGQERVPPRVGGGLGEVGGGRRAAESGEN